MPIHLYRTIYLEMYAQNLPLVSSADLDIQEADQSTAPITRDFLSPVQFHKEVS